MSSRRRQEANKEQLLARFGAMYEELYEWREAHPEASFDEIANQVTPLRRILIGERRWKTPRSCLRQEG